MASFVCPGHPLLDANIDLILERYRDLLKRGAMLVDPNDQGEEVRALFYLDHSIQDARTDRAGNRRVVSRQMQFVEIDSRGIAHAAGYAPYLDYRPLAPGEETFALNLLENSWLTGDLETLALTYAVSELVPRHFQEVKQRKEAQIAKTMAAVKDRLTKEINYWDHRAEELKAQELAGKTPRLNSAKARQRADELQTRLHKRMEDLEQERRLSPLPPVVIGGALVIPAGLLARRKGEEPAEPDLNSQEREKIAKIAMETVLQVEQSLGYEPRDVSAEKCGYDIESRIPGTGRLRFLEVKGRANGAKTVTITKNEILTALNKPEDFIVAVVTVEGEKAVLRYVRRPFQREPDFGVTSVNYDLADLLARSEAPA